MRSFRWAWLFVLIAVNSAWALDPSEILLIANGNAQVSKDLAAYYAQKRNIPAGNLMLLDLKSPEEISREEYFKKIADPVRDFLAKNDPEHKIKCLLTFTGLPIRIANRPGSPVQKEELEKITAEQGLIMPTVLAHVNDLELIAKKLDPTYKPPTELQVLAAVSIRVDRAVEHILQMLNAETNPDVRRAALERMFSDMEPLTGPSGRLQRAMFKDLPLPATQPTTGPTTIPSTSAAIEPTTQAAATEPAIPEDRRAILVQAQQRMIATGKAVQELANHQDNPAARVQLRNLVHDELGLITYARVLDQQQELLATSETGAAVDNELALVLWGDDYGLYRWIENPLYFRNARRMANAPPVMMVMRLDGTADDGSIVQNIINSSLAAEQAGLGGKVVIDSRGLPKTNGKGAPDAYGEYDETLRNLNKLLKEKTSLQVVFDDHEQVLRPNSVKDVGIYIGWYAVRNYIPSCSFRPGAVGFHVASLEMISLKSAGERGWVAGLLNDGIAATLGAVNEPYLHSFPKADEFFPLLFTGKLTLAEVYWRTNPLVSWQISMIGDPLYTPFKVDPALKEEDLPVDLQIALHLADRPKGPTTTSSALLKRR